MVSLRHPRAAILAGYAQPCRLGLRPMPRSHSTNPTPPGLAAAALQRCSLADNPAQPATPHSAGAALPQFRSPEIAANQAVGHKPSHPLPRKPFHAPNRPVGRPIHQKRPALCAGHRMHPGLRVGSLGSAAIGAHADRECRPATPRLAPFRSLRILVEAAPQNSLSAAQD